MIDSHELKRRDSYLNKLIGFQDTEPVKVITGIRRCGKSSLLKLMVQHLKDTGIQPEQIHTSEKSVRGHQRRAYSRCQNSVCFCYCRRTVEKICR